MERLVWVDLKKYKQQKRDMLQNKWPEKHQVDVL